MSTSLKKSTQEELATREPLLDAMIRESRQAGDAGRPPRGLELMGSKEQVIARLQLAQSMTPQAKKSDELYIPGVEEGVYFNSLTRRAYGSGPLRVVPIFAFVNAMNADAEGNIVCRSPDGVDCSRYGRGACRCETWRGGAADERNLPPECTKFINYVLFVVEDPNMPLVLSFKKTSMQVARLWTTNMKLLRRDIWETVWSLTSVARREGEYTWVEPRLVPHGWTKDLDGGADLVAMCAAAYEGLLDEQSRGLRENVRMDTDGLESELGGGSFAKEVPF